MAELRPQVKGGNPFIALPKALAPDASKGARPVRGRLVGVKTRFAWNNPCFLSQVKPRERATGESLLSVTRPEVAWLWRHSLTVEGGENPHRVRLTVA